MPATAMYVLECEEGAWYVGISYQPFKRFVQHMNGHSSWYTTAYKPKRLAYLHWYATRAKAEYMEEVMTALLRDQALKVGGGTYTVPSMSGRGRCRFETEMCRFELSEVLRVKTIPESFTGIPKRKVNHMLRSANWLIKHK